MLSPAQVSRLRHGSSFCPFQANFVLYFPILSYVTNRLLDSSVFDLFYIYIHPMDAFSFSPVYNILWTKLQNVYCNDGFELWIKFVDCTVKWIVMQLLVIQYFIRGSLDVISILWKFCNQWEKILHLLLLLSLAVTMPHNQCQLTCLW